MNFPDELSLMSLFECEPKLLDDNVLYYYNEATYAFSNKFNEKFLVSICAAYSDIKIQVYSGNNNELLSSYEFKGVDKVEVLSDKRDESKILIESEKISVKVNFKPRFKVILDYSNYN